MDVTGSVPHKDTESTVVNIPSCLSVCSHPVHGDWEGEAPLSALSERFNLKQEGSAFSDHSDMVREDPWSSVRSDLSSRTQFPNVLTMAIRDGSPGPPAPALPVRLEERSPGIALV